MTVTTGAREALSVPPGDSLGDAAPLAAGPDLVFQRRFGWADEGWVKRDARGNEMLLWRRADVTGSVGQSCATAGWPSAGRVAASP